MSNIVDAEDLLNRMDGDEELLAELVALFRDDAEMQMHLIRHALSEKDATTVFQSAHALKGSASNFSCPTVVESARVLEAAARAGSLEEAPSMIATLEEGVRSLLVALEPYTTVHH